MHNNLFWKRKVNETQHEVGLTKEAFEMFGQLWAIIPTNTRKRNYKEGEQLIAVEGSTCLSSLSIPFNANKVNFNGDALERPDEITTNTVLFLAEAA